MTEKQRLALREGPIFLSCDWGTSRVMAAECEERLKPYGKTLRDATNHFVLWLEAPE